MYWNIFYSQCIVSLGVGNDNLVQYSCMDNTMERGNWWVTIHGVAKSHTQFSNWVYILYWRTVYIHRKIAFFVFGWSGLLVLVRSIWLIMLSKSFITFWSFSLSLCKNLKCVSCGKNISGSCLLSNLTISVFWLDFLIKS